MATRVQYPLVYIIILNWNKLKETLECLESVLKTAYPNFKIVLIDNHSQDSSVQTIQERFPQVKVIESKSNLGYTGGNNLGIKYAIERGADYLWLLNNDTIIEKETLDNLVQSAQGDEKIGLVSPLIYFFDAPDKIEGCGRMIDWKKKNIMGLKTDRRTGPSENVSGPDIMVTGTALLIKKKVVDTIGYLDDSFFAYYEDDDYSIRALKAGFINLVAGSSKVFHKAPLSSSIRAPYYYYYLTRNRYHFRSKHFNCFSSRFAVFIDHFIHSFLFSGICAPGKNFMAVDASLEGAWAGFRGMTGPWKKNATVPLWLKRVLYPVIKTISTLLLLRRGVRKILSIAFLGFFLFILFYAEGSFAGSILTETFDELAHQNQIHLEGKAELIKERQGKSLRLPDRSYAVLSLPKKLYARAGTVMFWVRPLWNPADHQSHVFITGRWGDGKQGYFAISDGWWEPLGEKRLYFIVNNEETLFCSEKYLFASGEWTHITVSWKNGPSGRCRVFIDGTKIAEYASPIPGEYRLSSPIFVGSDMGATDRRNRASNFEVDDLKIYDYEMSDEFIILLDRKQYLQRTGKRLTGSEWMEPLIKHETAVPRRDRAGILRETRVLFDEDIHWAYSAEAANRILERVKAAGFNVYIPCVWHGRGTHYPTAVGPPDERLAGLFGAGYDPLGYLITKAHQLGIEVHPWFTVTRRDWSRYPEYFPAGTPDSAYDIHNSRFREFIVRLMLDVVRRYDVDGINLDYIRAMGICKSEECKKDYQTRSGSSLESDFDHRWIPGKARDHIEAWQDAGVAEVVRTFSEEAHKIKPGLIISVDGNPKAKKELRPLEGRDELRWIENGWIDVAFNMDYRVRIDYETIDDARRELSDPERIYPLFGNFNLYDGKQKSRTGEMIEKYVEFSRIKWPDSGFGFYIYHMLNDDQIETLKRGVFRESAKPIWPEVKILRESGVPVYEPATKGR